MNFLMTIYSLMAEGRNRPALNYFYIIWLLFTCDLDLDRQVLDLSHPKY